MAVTRSPHACSNRPMELIVTPFPRPETTPPVTIMYFILRLEGRRDGAIVVSHTVVVVNDDNDKSKDEKRTIS